MMMALSFPLMVSAQTEDEEIKALMAIHDGESAPDFKLRDLNGKEVSLTEFGGNWVVLDFWGSWCRFCVQGIPAMKEYYAKYHQQGLEIIGIDCGETMQQWRAAVERFELPWVNVYNPESKADGILAAYDIKGFPTKIIITPEGKIFKIYVGEDPAFYTELDRLFQ